MIRIICFDIIGGSYQEIIGEFQSVQMTDNELRDDNDNILLRYFDHVWFSIKTGNGWYDWTIEKI